jgi:16S rRNA (uracil1498-N3)-methyltransferase
VSGRPARGPADVDAVAHVFVDALSDRCEIRGPDGHHLRRVRRLGVGEVVTAADGSGAWRPYAVAEVTAGGLVLDATAPVAIAPAPSRGVALAVALTKGGLDDVVTALTELGVARITPVRSVRVVVRWDEERARRAVDRLRSVAREAAMQSRRAQIPVVDDVVDLVSVADRPGLVVADRNGVGASELPVPAPGAGWTALVGPEGGFAPDELSTLAQAPRLRLGPNVLRAVTAPIAAAAVLIAEASRLEPVWPE